MVRATLALCSVLAVAVPVRAQLVPNDGSPAIAVRSTNVEAIVEDGLARTTVRQTFVNTLDRPLEATYVFPLPEGSALVGVSMQVAGEWIEGRLAERVRARRTYDDIVRSKRDPALVEQLGRNTFRLSVFPVVPSEETVVEVSWIHRAPLSEGAFRYVYPLGLADPGKTEQDSSLTICMRSSVPFTSVTASRNDVHIRRVGEGEAVASFEVVGAVMDRDLTITGEVVAAKPDLAVHTFRHASEEDGWFLAVITPPRAREDQLLPRDVILVLDTSGSMKADDKLEQAKASALWLLDHLRPADRVNVLRFSSDVQAFAPEPVTSTGENRTRLEAFVNDMSAAGSTALGDALFTATQVPQAKGRVRTVVLLTDGLPTVGERNRAKLVGLARAGGDTGLRIFPFGVGPDVDSGLLRGIAAAGRGRAEIFRPGGEVAERLTSFLARTAAPVITDLSLSVEGVSVYDTFPRPLPDAYLGEQVTISGRYRGEGPAQVVVSGTVAGEPMQLGADHVFRAEETGSASVAHLFARQKLEYLEEARRVRLGLADDAYYAALDQGAYSTESEIVEEMISVSLAHGVQCAYTSFLVLLPGEPEPREAYQPNARDPDLLDGSPFDDQAYNTVIGIGGGAGGKFGGRFGGRKSRSGPDPAPSNSTLQERLAERQSPDGSWSRGDVGATGLALLVFLGNGNTTGEGPHKEVVARGVKWFEDLQDPDTGQLSGTIHDHAIATLALCEAYYFSKSPLFKRTAQDAVDHIVGARASEKTWRCGWALLALASAEDGGLVVDQAALGDAEQWIDGLTAEDGQAAIAMGLLGRAVLDQRPESHPVMVEHADLLLADPPEWGPDGTGRDLDLWLFGSCAMYQMGGRHWKLWSRAMKGALLKWSEIGAEEDVRSAATLGLCLQVYFRYSSLVGSR